MTTVTNEKAINKTSMVISCKGFMQVRVYCLDYQVNKNDNYYQLNLT